MSVGFINTHRRYPGGACRFRQSGLRKAADDHTGHEGKQKRYGRLYVFCQDRDDSVGVVLDALKRSGREDDTIVIFTTDHGIAFPFMKCNCYDTGIGGTLIP